MRIPHLDAVFSGRSLTSLHTFREAGPAIQSVPISVSSGADTDSREICARLMNTRFPDSSESENIRPASKTTLQLFSIAIRPFSCSDVITP